MEIAARHSVVSMELKISRNQLHQLMSEALSQAIGRYSAVKGKRFDIAFFKPEVLSVFGEGLECTCDFSIQLKKLRFIGMSIPHAGLYVTAHSRLEILSGNVKTGFVNIHMDNLTLQCQTKGRKSLGTAILNPLVSWYLSKQSKDLESQLNKMVNAHLIEQWEKIIPYRDCFVLKEQTKIPWEIDLKPDTLTTAGLEMNGNNIKMAIDLHCDPAVTIAKNAHGEDPDSSVFYRVEVKKSLDELGILIPQIRIGYGSAQVFLNTLLKSIKVPVLGSIVVMGLGNHSETELIRLKLRSTGKIKTDFEVFGSVEIDSNKRRLNFKINNLKYPFLGRIPGGLKDKLYEFLERRIGGHPALEFENLRKLLLDNLAVPEWEFGAYKSHVQLELMDFSIEKIDWNEDFFVVQPRFQHSVRISMI